MTRSFYLAQGIAAVVAFSFAGASLAAPSGQGTYTPAPQAYQAPSGYSPQAYTQPPRYTTAPYAAVQQAPASYTSYPALNYRTAGLQQRYAMQDAPAPAHVPQPESVPQPAPNNYATPVAPGTGDCGCNTGAPAANNWGGYVQGPVDSGCNTGGYGAYGYDAGACDYGNFGGGGFGNGFLRQRASNRQWFFGAYGLFMSRDNPGYEKIAVLVDSPAAYPYYPTQAETILATTDVDADFQWGAEIRFGSTFGQAAGCNSCDQGYGAYGCDTGCNTQCGPQPYAWEVVYWGLSEDDQQEVRTDALADTDRIYGSMNFAGLEYDRDGAGATYAYRPMNDYFDYQMPITDPALNPTAIRVVGIRARNYFKAQNLELNFIRFPLANCNPCGEQRFTVNGVCGVRYMKLDEDLQIATQFSDPAVAGDPVDYTGSFPPSDDNNLFYDISTDNELVGFQFGSNMNWLIGCKWSAFCDTQFGIYGNKINNSHRFWSGTGIARFVGTGGDANVRTTKTDVSFLGEARMGIGYQVGCNCRWTTAYRVIAITGVALSGEQLKNDYANAEYVGIIDSNDSIVLHGLQTGLEWKY